MRPTALVPALLLLLAAPAAGARPVATEPLRGPSLVEGDLSPPGAELTQCSDRSARIQRWTPADGPAAAFIADVFVAPKSNEWIGRGYDEQGYWAAEVTVGDACDSCAQLTLSRTGFDGRRTEHPLASYVGIAPETRDEAMTALHRLGAGPWNVGRLRHDATLRVPRRNAEGRVEGFTGWVVEVRKGDAAGGNGSAGSFLLRVAATETPFMCWCHAGFRGYTLAAPRPR